MSEEEFLKKFPWIDPVADKVRMKYRPEAKEHDQHYATRGACHKIMAYMKPIHSKHLDHTDGHDWELFRASHRGTIDGVEYLWGMFVEGLGMFNVMIPLELSRPITSDERAAWSKVRLGMYGSHSGNLSYTFNSGVNSEG
jgi:hypothetical protein